MTENPPKLALWLLKLAAADTESLTGDLVEQFREGRSKSWFWKQVVIAMAAGSGNSLRRQWPALSYAVAGVLVNWFLYSSFDWIKFRTPWASLPFPLSWLLFTLSPYVIMAWSALPVLAIALAIRGTFHWAAILQTALLSPVLIVIGHLIVMSLLMPLFHPLSNCIMLFLPLLAAAWTRTRGQRRIPVTA